MRRSIKSSPKTIPPSEQSLTSSKESPPVEGGLALNWPPPEANQQKIALIIEILVVNCEFYLLGPGDYNESINIGQFVINSKIRNEPSVSFKGKHSIKRIISKHHIQV